MHAKTHGRDRVVSRPPPDGAGAGAGRCAAVAWPVAALPDGLRRGRRPTRRAHVRPGRTAPTIAYRGARRQRGRPARPRPARASRGPSSARSSTPRPGHHAAAVWTSDDGRELGASDVRPVGTAPSTRRWRRWPPTDDGPGGGGPGGRRARVRRRSLAPGRRRDWAGRSRPPETGRRRTSSGPSKSPVGDGGILVAGGENAWGEVRPRLWFSADGEAWSSVDGGPAGRSTPPARRRCGPSTAVGDGVRRRRARRSVDDEQDGVAWFSADGESWEESTPRPGAGGAPGAADRGGRSAAWSSPAATRTTCAGQGKPVVWRSADGRGWNPPVTAAHDPRQPHRRPRPDACARCR